MLKPDRSELDYAGLVKKARRLVAGHGQKMKIALLADVSTQHLVPLLRALFASNGIEAEIYEAAYDAIELEALNPASDLYAFGPQIVVIIQSIWKLKSLFYDFPDDRSTFSQVRAGALESLWGAIQERTRASVIQSTVVLPYERPFGNYGLKMDDTLHGAVTHLNNEIITRSRSFPSVFINDIDNLAAWVGRSHFLDEKLWALSKSLCALHLLPQVAQNIVDIGLAIHGRAIKCVVVDLDNTLWGGVVGDDGLEGIGLGDLDEGHAFRFLQLYLRDLSRRGVMIAVCSKNEESVARRVFREHPDMVLKEEHIATFVANWEDKATNIRRIRETLNIGFDAMVFLDDNPFERNLVRAILPEVVVPELPADPALYVRALSELNLFETASHSSLDAQRNALYQDQQQREGERARAGDIGTYLRSLDTTAVFSPFEPGSISRIAQLIQRSNQFNLTTRRYSETECDAMMRNDHTFAPFSVTLRDRFGDFGLINVVILRKGGDALEIDTFLMSCRVLQRGVEQYTMNKIVAYARRHGFTRVVGRYLPTAKNMMVKTLFSQFGFTPVAESNGTEWTLPVDKYVPHEVFIRDVPAMGGTTEGEAQR